MKLNLGCGTDIKKGFINIDKIKLNGVDMILNIEKGLPFKSNSVEYINCETVLEHIPKPHKLIGECYRVLKWGGCYI